MKRMFNFKLAALCVLLCAALVAPALGQTPAKPEHPQAPAQSEHPKAQAPAQPAPSQAPTPVQGMEKAKGPEQGEAMGHKAMGDQFKQRRMAMIKKLNLPPDKEKAVLAVEDKYVQQRKATIDNLKKAHADLEKALASPKPDETKIKENVGMLTSGMDAIFNSFKSQRDEELALMTPVEQGKYLVEMGKLRQEMMGKKMPQGKKKK